MIESETTEKREWTGTFRGVSPRAMKIRGVFVKVVSGLLCVALSECLICCCKRQVWFRGNDNCIRLVLWKGDGSVIVNTHASVFQKFSILPISGDRICMYSSDIGACEYGLDEAGRVRASPALYLKYGKSELYVIYNIRVKGMNSPYKRISEGVRLIFSRNGKIEERKIEGKFRYFYEALSSTKSGKVIIKGEGFESTFQM